MNSIFTQLTLLYNLKIKNNEIFKISLKKYTPNLSTNIV